MSLSSNHTRPLPSSRSSSSSSNDKEEPKPRKARIYTRTGDKGTTSLYSGERVSKTHSIIATLGDNDELTSQLGVTLEFCRQHPVVRAHLEEQLLYIQCRLQELNSHIATPGDGEARRVLFDVKGTVVAQLERWIDDLDVKLPPLTTFILPSGGMASAHLHVARSVCRRAERSLHGLIEADVGINVNAGKFLNRLSDYLFTAARLACHLTDGQESTYKALP